MPKKTEPRLPVFARRLRALREAAALTPNALAVRAGLSPIQVMRIESGERGCTWETAVKLADALGCSLDALRK